MQLCARLSTQGSKSDAGKSFNYVCSTIAVVRTPSTRWTNVLWTTAGGGSVFLISYNLCTYVFFPCVNLSVLQGELAPRNLWVVKRLSDTRWSAHADTVAALINGYSAIAALLDRIRVNPDENEKTRAETQDFRRRCKSWRWAQQLNCGMLS